jgi:hypothetical protein
MVEHPGAAQVTQRPVTVGGHPATLLEKSIPARPVNSVEIIITVGDTTALLVAGSGGPATPGGPDVNPLLDEQTFLNVLQNLRPYPQ